MTTCCDNAHLCIDIFYRNFVPEYICLPTPREAVIEAEKLSEMSGECLILQSDKDIKKSVGWKMISNMKDFKNRYLLDFS